MFRFTIRDMLWLTVVVALGVGWWLDHGRLLTIVGATQSKLEATDIESREFQRLAQVLAESESDILRAIEESGLVIVRRFGHARLEKIEQGTHCP